jgi:hypothetical protein
MPLISLLAQRFPASVLLLVVLRWMPTCVLPEQVFPFTVLLLPDSR